MNLNRPAIVFCLLFVLLFMSCNESQKNQRVTPIGKKSQNSAAFHLIETADKHYSAYFENKDQEELKKAVVQVEEAIRLEPGVGDHYIQLSHLLLILGQLNNSGEFYQRAYKAQEKGLKIAPEYKRKKNVAPLAYIQALKNLLDISTDEDLKIKIIPHLKEAIKENPNYANSHSVLGNIYMVLGKQELARMTLVKAVSLNPDIVGAQRTLGRIYLKDLKENPENEKAFNNALKAFKAVKRTDPEDSEAKKILAGL